jgi:hypothetical protein
MIERYTEIAKLGGRALAEQLGNLPVLVKLGQITRDQAFLMLDRYMNSSPYEPTQDPDTVRARLADPDWQQWFALREGPERDRQKVRRLVYRAIGETGPPRASTNFLMGPCPKCGVGVMSRVMCDR